MGALDQTPRIIRLIAVAEAYHVSRMSSVWICTVVAICLQGPHVLKLDPPLKLDRVRQTFDFHSPMGILEIIAFQRVSVCDSSIPKILQEIMFV